jgi:signal transduction histidine kinase
MAASEDDPILALSEENQALREQIGALLTATAGLVDGMKQLQENQEALVHTHKTAAVGTLVAGLAHELNNPLGIILGFGQCLLKRLPANDPLRPGLEAIERQAMRCAQMVRLLGDFAQRPPAPRTRITVKSLLERVAVQSAAQPVAVRNPLELKPSVAQYAELQVCVLELETALLHLVRNASDASLHHTPVVIEVRRRIRRSQEGVELNIQDQGTGIAPEHLPRIFDPFFTTKPVGQGTGFGLALTRKVIESHGGSIEVQTQLGRGTSMRVWLPVAEPLEERDEITRTDVVWLPDSAGL